MTDHTAEPFQGEPAETPRARRKPRNPAMTLASAMVVYIFLNLAFALPLVTFPTAYFGMIGLDSSVADELGGLRWVGASLLAWGIIGIIVLARPEGRAVFVTAGAAQLSFAALALLYSWSVREYQWSTWYQAIASGLMVIGAIYMWWARMSGRKVLKGAAANS